MGRIILAFCCVCFGFFPLQGAQLLVKWQFTGIDQAFIRPAAMELLINGIKQPLSGCFSQAETGMYETDLPDGKNKLDFVVWVRQQEQWEKHLQENDYALDAMFSVDTLFTQNQVLILRFDVLRQLITAVWENDLLENNPRLLDLSLRSVFTNIPDGFDLKVRYRIYGNGDLLFTSEEGLMSTLKWVHCKVPYKTENLKIVLEVLYKGFWEEHLAVFGYQMDAVYFMRGNYRKAQIFTLKASVLKGDFHVTRHKKRAFS